MFAIRNGMTGSEPFGDDAADIRWRSGRRQACCQESRWHRGPWLWCGPKSRWWT